jgi:flagellar hook-basal body complex protein FliE
MSLEQQIASISLAATGIQEPAIAPQATMPLAVAHPAASPTSFGNLVSQGLEQVNQEMLQSQAGLQQLATGNAQNLHQIMIQLEESKLSFQLVMQVRNRLLDAYQDVMKMQL